MRKTLIDTHIHIQNNIENIITEASKEGVRFFVLAGTTIKDSKQNIELSKKHKNIWPAVGIYPHSETSKSLSEIYQNLRKLLRSRNVAAIGECGLDYNKSQRPKEEQKELFRLQIGLSIQKDLPLIIHCRNAFNDTLRELSLYKETHKLKGVFHCYSGDLETAKKILDMGFYISFSGIITYKSGRFLENVIKEIPLEKILIETDSPYLVPEPARSMGVKTNEPKYVKLIAEKIAEIKNINLTKVANTTTNNAFKLFKPKWKTQNLQ